MPIIDYNAEPTFTKSLEIDDIGQCCIKGTDEIDFADYYIAVQSVGGFAYILKLGPIIPDLEPGELTNFSLEYKQIKYSLKGIKAEISKFLNDYKKAITVAEIVDLQEALEAVPGSDAFIPA